MNSSTNNPNLPSYLLSRFHEHLNHLNDMAFTHTKILQEIIEKHANEPIASSPQGSISSSSSASSSTTIDEIQQRKRSYSSHENHTNKRPRKQSKPQQHVQIDQTKQSEDEEITEKKTLLPIPPFLNYIQELTRMNNITSPEIMGQFLQNLAIESRRFPPFFPSHPYISPILLNNSLINHFPPPLSSNALKTPPTFPFHFSTPKKRRTKVTDTRLSPRITPKLPLNDLSDDEHSSSSDNLSRSDHQPMEYNGFQITLTPLHLRKAKLMFFYTRYPNSTVLKEYFPDVRFGKLNTAQLVKWFSNFREFFYQQIEKYARQCLAEGIRHVDDLIITPNSELYRTLNIHYNRSNQINVPISFCTAAEAALKEFFLAIQQQKDLDSSWKKSIYKVMQRLDDQLPDFFKNDHWMHSI